MAVDFFVLPEKLKNEKVRAVYVGDFNLNLSKFLAKEIKEEKGNECIQLGYDNEKGLLILKPSESNVGVKVAKSGALNKSKVFIEWWKTRIPQGKYTIEWNDKQEWYEGKATI